MTLQFDSVNGRFSVDVGERFGTDGHIQRALNDADRWAHANEPLKAAAILDPLARTFALAAQWEAAAYTFRRLIRVLDGLELPGPEILAKRERKAQRLAVATAHRIEEMAPPIRSVVNEATRSHPDAFLWLSIERPELLHDALDAAIRRTPEPVVFFMVLSAAVCGFARKAVSHRLSRLSYELDGGVRLLSPSATAGTALPPIESVYGLPPAMVAGIYALLPAMAVVPAIVA